MDRRADPERADDRKYADLRLALLIDVIAGAGVAYIAIVIAGRVATISAENLPWTGRSIFANVNAMDVQADAESSSVTRHPNVANKSPPSQVV